MAGRAGAGEGLDQPLGGNASDPVWSIKYTVLSINHSLGSNSSCVVVHTYTMYFVLYVMGLYFVLCVMRYALYFVLCTL